MLRISLVRYILMFILLALLQVVVLNSISFLSFAIPLVYIYFILKLPASLNQNLTLLLGFFLGFSIDIFCNTPGINAAATTFAAFLRKPIMSIFFIAEDYADDEPSVSSVGTAPFMKYTFALVLIHMIVLVSLEAFSYFSLQLMVLRVICSTIVTTIIIFGFEGFGINRKKSAWRKI